MAKKSKRVPRKVMKKAVKKTAKSPKTSIKSKKPARRVQRAPQDELLMPIKGATARVIGGVKLEVASAGAARIKRMIYPAGFRWSKAMKPVTGTDYCMHAHVGFLARGEIHIEYPDGCVAEFKAPQVVTIDPGHDGWVVGRQPAVMIEIDFEGDTIAKLGMPTEHRH